MKYLFVMTTSSNVINFRADLIRFLIEKGHEVSVIAHDYERKGDVLNLGVSAFYCAKQNNRSLNPFSILTYQKTLKEIISKEKPDYLFTYQLKPNVFGTIAGKKAGVKNVYSFVEGLGDVYVNSGFKWRLIRFVVSRLYKRGFKACKKVFVLNNDDKDAFLSLKIVQKDKIAVLPGTGVNTERFTPAPIEKHDDFIMVARMNKAKGVLEYCKCARRVKALYPNANFNYLGCEGDLKLSDIQEYIDDKSINYLGEVKDVRPYLNDNAVLVLPSYREGMPVSVMEAQSSGRAVLVTACPGSKDTVKDGFNGFLVPIKDVDALVEKATYFINNPNAVKEMGANAREFALVNFDCKRINNLIYSLTNANA
ncbi:MAG: glycosyltransferase family 4 protein [Clostridia bacterium]|nr:glycosyltransferase family 4 protein [Clostridia bacterium]